MAALALNLPDEAAEDERPAETVYYEPDTDMDDGVSLSIRHSDDEVTERDRCEAENDVAFLMGRPDGFFGLDGSNFVRAEEQQPRKPRGRKPKAKAAASGGKGGKRAAQQAGSVQESKGGC